jgi:spore coat-associated protein N
MPSSSLIPGLAIRGLVAAGATAALAVSVAARPEAHPATLQTLRTAGAAAAISDSRGGDAILRAGDMRAGDAVTGDVTIGWSGDTPAAVTLAPRGLSGSLASALSIAVDDRTTGRRVYDGPLGQMGSVPLDAFAAGSSHDFRFTVTLADNAPDSLQGAAASLLFDWTATADDRTTTTDTTTATPPAPAPPTTTSPGNPTTSPPPDTRAPHVTLGAAKLAVRAACDEPCTFSASVKLTGAKGVKKPKLHVKASGTSATVTLAFDKASLKLLKKLHAKATVAVVARDAAGNRTTAAKQIALKP